MGLFHAFECVYYDPFRPYNSSYTTLHTFSSATGFIPKFYLFRHRIVSLFAGHELDIGFTAYRYSYYYYNNSYSYYYPPQDLSTHYFGTVAGLGIAGISINPKDRFNMTIHGGAGEG